MAVAHLAEITRRADQARAGTRHAGRGDQGRDHRAAAGADVDARAGGRPTPAASGVRPPAVVVDRRGGRAAGGTGAGGHQGGTPRCGMSGPTLLAVAHGSSDPQAQQTIRALAGQVSGWPRCSTSGRVRPERRAVPGRGARRGRPADAVIVPLLLSTGYHLSTDIGAAAARAGVAGGRPARARPAAGHRAGGPPRRGGRARREPRWCWPPPAPSDPRATADARTRRLCWPRSCGVPVLAAFAAAGQPTVRGGGR